MQIPYYFVPIIALFCYSFMFITFLAAKKSKVIYSFIVILVAFIFWTAGSLFMRLQLLPGVEFWFEVSIIALFMLPLLFFNFVHAFIGKKGYALKLFWTICTLVIILLNWFHVFIQHPKVVDLGNGQASFIYSVGWPVIIPMIFTTLVIISIIMMIVEDVRKNQTNARRFTPIIIGSIILFLGNVLDIVPAIGKYPVDTLAGIINAFFMVFALYKGRLFNLTLLISRGTTYLILSILIAIFFANFIRPFEYLLIAQFPAAEACSTLIIAVLFAVTIVMLHHLIKKILDQIFIRDEIEQAEILKLFSQEVAKSLDLQSVLDALVQAVKKGIKVDKVFICLPDDKRQAYMTAYSLSPLDAKGFKLSYTNPCITWFASNNNCILVKDIQYKTLFKAMWLSEKKQLSDLEVECLVPLKCDDELAGLLLLTKKERNRAFSFDDINFLESINSVGSIAIKNARLYAQAYHEAHYDELTGLLNRKYFHEILNKEFNKNQHDSLGLLILNVDNFKLFNQLFGNREGDLALYKISRIIQTSIDSNVQAARYSGKEFALILPGYDALAIVKLAENIRRQVAAMNQNEEDGVIKGLTMSCGICVYPYSAATAKQLIENADMAVFNAKRGGRNKVELYSLRDPQIKETSVEPLIKPEVYDDYMSTIYALTAAIDVKDHYTFNHSQKVAEYASILARAISLNDEHVEIVRQAALLHDIGKIGIPEDILNKKNELTAQEYDIMKSHVENSIAMIRHLPSLDYVIPAVLGHHERWDGKGYPRGLAGEDIPIAARCLAVADAFDAMTTARPYKQALSIEFATQEIGKHAGRQFDPRLAQVFIELVANGRIKLG